jgi:hypothetical protein
MTHFSWTIDGGIVVLHLLVTMLADIKQMLKRLRDSGDEPPKP